MEPRLVNCTPGAAYRKSAFRLGVAALLCCPLLLTGCHQGGAVEDKAPAPSDPPDKAATAGTVGKPQGDADAAEGVSLTPEEVARMGIETTTLVATKHAPEASGFGMVMSHEAIAQGVADLAMAVAVDRQSQAAYQRSKGLAGTAGAMPLDTLEAAERQAAVDRATLELERRRLSSIYGQNPPWKDDDSPELKSLASGRSKLVRVTFPLGALGTAEPGDLRFAHLAGGIGGKTWKSTSVWRAPADSSIPGKSYFALLREDDFAEGERVLAWAALGEPEDGVTIPAGAAVITAGKYWFYVEKKPGVFVRTELDTGSAVDTGYFVRRGASAGDRVVTSAAGQLLARDLNPSKEAD